MRSIQRSVVSASLFGLSMVCGSSSLAASRPASARVEAAVLGAFDQGVETVRVIVNLSEPPAACGPEERRARIRELQGGVIGDVGAHLSVSRTFSGVPAFVGHVTREGLESLRQDPRVSYIQVDERGHGASLGYSAVPVVGGDRAKSTFGLTGRGVTVAILDSGIDNSHPDFRGAVVAQQCFTDSDCGPLGENRGASAEDDNGHGSNVAGVVASRGVVAPVGFAPSANIVAVKVDDASDSGFISDWVAGLDWVYENLSTLHVGVINMSICSNALFSDASSCDAGEPALAAAVHNLVGAGVTIFAATGNVGSATSMAAPACNSGVVAVGATYVGTVGDQPAIGGTYSGRWGASFADCSDSNTTPDQVTCFTNSNARLDLVAPGAPILSDYLQGETDTFWGTSQASPAAAGVAAMMLQCAPSLTPAEVKEALVHTGVPVTDPKNGLSFPSLRAFDAVASVCGTDGGPALSFTDDGGSASPGWGTVLPGAEGTGSGSLSAAGADGGAGAATTSIVIGEKAGPGGGMGGAGCTLGAERGARSPALAAAALAFLAAFRRRARGRHGRATR